MINLLDTFKAHSAKLSYFIQKSATVGSNMWFLVLYLILLSVKKVPIAFVSLSSHSKVHIKDCMKGTE